MKQADVHPVLDAVILSGFSSAVFCFAMSVSGQSVQTTLHATGVFFLLILGCKWLLHFLLLKADAGRKV